MSLCWIPSEAAFQANVIALARIYGWLVYHTFDSRRSAPGYPDLCLARGKDGRLIFAELKRTGGKVRPEQRAWLEALSKVPGVEVHVWMLCDWSAIEETLR